MKFTKLAEYFEKLEKKSGRLEMTEILAELFGEADDAPGGASQGSEIDKIVYLSLGRLGPKFANPEFNLAEKMVMRSIGLTYNLEMDEVLQAYKQEGDLGEVVYSIEQKNKSTKKQKENLSINQVYDRLLRIAEDEGKDSQERKVKALAGLLNSVDGLSAKYLVRIPVGKLRLGFSEMTILDALSWMVTGGKSLSGQLEDAYNVRADVGSLAKMVKEEIQKEILRQPQTTQGLRSASSSDKSTEDRQDDKAELKSLSALSNVAIKLGTPIVAALCQRLKTFDEMIDKMGEVVVEPKYDGTRLQIHFSRKNGFAGNSKFEIRNSKQFLNSNIKEQNENSKQQSDEKSFFRSFTRNLEENSQMFPELDKIGDQLKADEVILDCEAIGIDQRTGKWLPFQMTMTRKRKHDVVEQMEKVKLKFLVFDVLYVRGREILRHPELSSSSVKTWADRHQFRNPQDDKADLKSLPALSREGGDVHQFPLNERKQILEKIIKPGEYLEVAPYKVTTDPEVCRKLHLKYLKQGLEGVVVKKWDSEYVPGRKGWNWVKMKEVEDAAAGLADTMDCVVMGYYRGKGQRAKFGLGAFLVGVVADKETEELKNLKTEKQMSKRNNKQDNNGQTAIEWDVSNTEKSEKTEITEDRFLTVSKIGTGLTDEQFRELAARLRPLEVKDKPEEYVVNKTLLPDVWVKPKQVVEIAADNITESKVHTTGYGLRFPRLVKFRDDKSAEGAGNLSEVIELFEMQGN